jgi:hypothetical protein
MRGGGDKSPAPNFTPEGGELNLVAIKKVREGANDPCGLPFAYK